MSISRYLNLVLAILSCHMVFAQKQNNNWVFEVDHGINFNTVPPTHYKSNFSHKDVGGEVAAAMSDRNTGELMFYTDGYHVYNRKMSLMPNGYGIGNDTPRYSCRQGAVIVPMPGYPDLHYIFTLNDALENGSLRYSIVDMKLEGGLGDVVPAERAVFIDSNFAEAMAVAKGNDCSIWVLVVKRNLGELHAYHITKSGINVVPIVSSYPSVHSGNLLKVSNNSMLCLAEGHNFQTHYSLMKFDPATGRCSDFEAIDNAPLGDNMGTFDFSPTGRYLYIIDSGSVHQYDMSPDSMQDRVSSKRSLAYASSIPGASPKTPRAAELAPDGNIYFTTGRGSLSMVYNTESDFPRFAVATDSLGIGGGVNSSLASRVVLVDEATTVIHTKTVCGNTSLSLEAPAGALSYRWQDGSIGNSQQVQQAGKYWVRSVFGCGYRTDTFKTEHLQLELGKDTAIRKGTYLVLDTRDNISQHEWNTGATGSQLSVNTPRTYSVVLSRNGCKLSDSIRIHELIIPNCQPYVPTAFTPNGDGRNDKIRPQLALSCLSISVQNS